MSAWLQFKTKTPTTERTLLIMTRLSQQDDLITPGLTFSAAGLVPLLPAHWLRRCLFPLPGWWALQEAGWSAPPQDLVQPGASPLGGVTAEGGWGEEGSKVDPLVKNCLVTKLTTVLKGPGPQRETMSPVLVCDRLKLVPSDYVQPH